MTKQEQQKSLDKKKWLYSQELGRDLSGTLVYCEHCDKAVSNKCTATQEERESKCLCAKAFNRMQRKGQKV